MIRALAGFAAGLLFGLGLVVGGMANPAKVLAFLDVAGVWDPSLALVLAGAVAVALPGYRLLLRLRPHPVLAPRYEMPTAREVDARLLGGAALFGVGWGIGGFCPGPAWVALPLAAPGTLAFLPAMLIGMALAARMERGGTALRRRTA